nr:hypothetical protein CFP56_03367 [Quercus suber]
MAPQTRARNGLQCFDENRYFMPQDHNQGTQCIAPTTSGKQCAWDISDEEVYEIVCLTVELQSTVGTGSQYNILERIMLLRVCGDTHREKLEAKFSTDRSCLNRFLMHYMAQVIITALTPQKIAALFPAQMPGTSAPQSAMRNRKGGLRHRYMLRPREVGSASRPGLSSPDAIRQIFVPYPSRPDDNINDVLLSAVPQHFKATGCVYALTWPSEEGYIKIGYSSISVNARLSRWRQCHPGIKVLHSMDCPYPERIERLVHLQLSSLRHQIKICPQCNSTHFEWFRIPDKEVIETMDTWKTLTEHGGLYDTNRNLLSPWVRRIADFDTAITAQGLLEVRRSETHAEAEALALATQAATMKMEAEASEARVFVKPTRIVETICWKTARILPQKSLAPDLDSILDSFGDFMRLITMNIP